MWADRPESAQTAARVDEQHPRAATESAALGADVSVELTLTHRVQLGGRRRGRRKKRGEVIYSDEGAAWHDNATRIGRGFFPTDFRRSSRKLEAEIRAQWCISDANRRDRLFTRDRANKKARPAG